jgi:hypothetical protein
VKYFFVPSDSKGLLDADYTHLLEQIHFQQDKAIVQVNDDVIPRDTWTPATVNDWDAKMLGVATADPLTIAKAKKLQELQSASDEATKTFKSSALGEEKTYLADEKSMTFLAGEYAFVKSPDYDESTTDWYTVEDNNFVTHTGEQIVKVFLDGRAWIKEQKTVKLKSLLADVGVAQTVDDVNKITW